jgi:hypothetical protein
MNAQMKTQHSERQNWRQMPAGSASMPTAAAMTEETTMAAIAKSEPGPGRRSG